MKKLLFLFLLLPCLSVAFAQKTDAGQRSVSLEKDLRGLMAGFRGQVGVYVRNLKTGQTVSINADTLFPTASTVKIPIQCGLFDKINRGEVNYASTLTYKDSIHYDDGIVGSLRDGAKIPLAEVVLLMETTSDNTASLWCQAIAGGGTAINEWLDANGFPKTRVNSRTLGREANRTQYGWGQTTPRELAELLAYIRAGRAISPAASDRMYRNLTRQYWDGEGLSQLPPDVKTGSKNGAVNKSRSEVVLVHAPHGEYVYCLMTKNQQDESWTETNEGFVLLRKLGALFWRHFEPKSGWKPVAGGEKFGISYDE